MTKEELSQQWISVEDALPKDVETYLVRTEDGYLTAWYYMQRHQWHDIVEGMVLHPTHWMPIPELPKQD